MHSEDRCAAALPIPAADSSTPYVAQKHNNEDEFHTTDDHAKHPVHPHEKLQSHDASPPAHDYAAPTSNCNILHHLGYAADNDEGDVEPNHIAAPRSASSNNESHTPHCAQEHNQEKVEYRPTAEHTSDLLHFHAKLQLYGATKAPHDHTTVTHHYSILRHQGNSAENIGDDLDSNQTTAQNSASDDDTTNNQGDSRLATLCTGAHPRNVRVPPDRQPRQRPIALPRAVAAPRRPPQVVTRPHDSHAPLCQSPPDENHTGQTRKRRALKAHHSADQRVRKRNNQPRG